MDIKGIENIRAHRAIRKWDIIALLIFLAILVALLVVMFMPKGATVEVYDDGDLVYIMNMTDYGEYDVHGKLTFVIDEEGVMVKDAICPDKLCEKQGHVHTKGASIVCLPSKITVVIRGNSDDVVVVG